MLPIMISEGHHRRGLPLSRIADLLCANPARAMGLPGKGAIALGNDADLALVDLDAQWTVARDKVWSNAGFSLYEGETVRGKVVHTLVRGRSVFRDGALDPDAVGHGRYLKRKLQFAG
jgi:dihydroorotase-like cyclic amidohydrolase